MTGYLCAAEDSPLWQAIPGQRISVPIGPPWLVVHHDLDRQIITRWPARLFRVTIAPPETEAEQENLALAASGLLADAGYTRALRVDVLEELDPAVLFGPHGAAVADILTFARTLTLEQATHLMRGMHDDAGGARDRLWRAWLGDAAVAERDYSEVLGIPAHGGSPAGKAPSLVYLTVLSRAKSLSESYAVDGDVLVSPWNRAVDALADAALALAAQDFIGGDDRDILLRAWQSRAERRPKPLPRKVTLFEHREPGKSWYILTAILEPDATLRVDGHILGGEEYEWGYRFGPEVVPALVAAMGGQPGENVLGLLQARFHGHEADRQFRAFLDEHGIERNFWHWLNPS